MTSFLRYLRLACTPGVCAKHALRKNYLIGHSLSGPYYVCPQCIEERTAANSSNSPEFVERKRREMADLKIAVK